jgi:hypothetical protein
MKIIVVVTAFILTGPLSRETLSEAVFNFADLGVEEN